MRRNRLWKIIEHYGEGRQLNKAIEECNELIDVLKQCREEYPNAPKEHLAEELADVAVMMQQIMLIYGIESDDVIDISRYKIVRTLLRMCEEDLK